MVYTLYNMIDINRVYKGSVSRAYESYFQTQAGSRYIFFGYPRFIIIQRILNKYYSNILLLSEYYFEYSFKDDLLNGYYLINII